MGYGKPEKCERMNHRRMKRNGKSHPTRGRDCHNKHRYLKLLAKKRRRLDWKQKGEDAPTKVPHYGFH